MPKGHSVAFQKTMRNVWCSFYAQGLWIIPLRRSIDVRAQRDFNINDDLRPRLYPWCNIENTVCVATR